MKILVLMLILFSLVKCDNINNQPIINRASHHVIQHEQAAQQLKDFLKTQTFFEDLSTSQFEKYKEQSPSLKCISAIGQIPQLTIAKCKFFFLFNFLFIQLLIHSSAHIHSSVHSFSLFS